MQQDDSRAASKAKMQSALFAFSVFLNSVVWQFLLVVILGTSWFEGEEAEGLGLMWILSLPFSLVLSCPTALFFRRYERIQSLRSRVLIYSIIIVLISLLAASAVIGLIILTNHLE